MAEVFGVAGWPSSSDCISWSEDNLIAVAARETLNILVPIYAIGNHSEPTWKHLPLDVSLFTFDEAPARLPLHWPAWSISEELSERHLVDVQWSAAGPSIFGRCLLGVLTSNDVLSVWECVGTPTIREDWQRSLIINHSMLERNLPPSTGKAKAAHAASWPHRARRVRAFTWSKPLPSGLDPDHISRGGKAILVAVADDNGWIVILRLKSPYQGFQQDLTFENAIMMQEFSADPSSTAVDTVSVCLPSPCQNKTQHVTQIAWSSWITDSTGAMISTLAYTVHSTLFLKTVRIVQGSDELFLDDLEFDIMDTLSNIRGPMKWSLPDESQNHLDLFCLNGPELFKVTTNYDTPHSVMVQSMAQVDRPVEEMTGLAVSPDQRLPTVNVVFTNAAIDQCYRAMKDVQGSDLRSSQIWEEHAKVAEKAFSTERNTKVTMRISPHGCTYDASGAFLASCMSFHPLHGLEYAIAVRQMSFVTLVPAEHGEPRRFEELLTDLSHVSSESMILILRARLRTRPPGGEVEGLVNRLAACLDPSSRLSFQQYRPEDNPILPSVDLSASFYEDASVVRAQARRLLHIAYEGLKNLPSPDTEILKASAQLISTLQSQHGSASALSQAICSVYLAIADKLSGSDADTSMDPSLSDRPQHEKCRVCAADIQLESLQWARCAKGHQHKRCALTYTAIQMPGITKSCGLCGLECLSEHKLGPEALIEADGTQGTGDLAPVPDPFLEHLFSVCAVCVHCGGKYVA